MIAPAIATISASRLPPELSNCAARTSSTARSVEQRHSGTARLDHYRSLAPAKGDAADPDHAGLSPPRADASHGFDGDRAIRIEVVRRIEVEGRFPPWHERFQVNHFRAFDIERLQLLRREGHELSAFVFVALHDV